MGKLLDWKLNHLVEMAVITLLNKFDFVVAISGSRGLGKSTLSIIFARRVASEFKKLYSFDGEVINYYYERLNLVNGNKISYEAFIEKIFDLKLNKSYQFKLKRDTIYRRDKAIELFNDLNRIGILDEAVTSMFSRDFYNEEQKNLIKIINTNRDKAHLFLFAIPSFSVIDNQIRNLTKMHLTVLRRGKALVQTPNSTIFSTDIWDKAHNQKVERNWIEGKTKRPQWSKLSTSRGFVKFPPLREKMEKIYIDHKTAERNIIAKEDYGVEKEVKKDPIDKFVEQIIKNGIENEVMVKGFAMAHDMKVTSLIGKLRRKLLALNKSPKLASYYWDKGYTGEGSFNTDVTKSKTKKKIAVMVKNL